MAFQLDGRCRTRATHYQDAGQRSKHDRRGRYSQGRSHRGRIAVDEDVVDQLLHLAGYLSRQASWKVEASALAATNLEACPGGVADNWFWRTAPMMATPTALPSWRVVFKIPDAVPASTGVISRIASVITGAMTMPIPRPVKARGSTNVDESAVTDSAR